MRPRRPLKPGRLFELLLRSSLLAMPGCEYSEELEPFASRAQYDERWTEEHGFLADNPLLDEIQHASDRLRENPQVGVLVRRGRFRSEARATSRSQSRSGGSSRCWL